MIIYSVSNCIKIFCYRNKYDISANSLCQQIIKSIKEKKYDLSTVIDSIEVVCHISLYERLDQSRHGDDYEITAHANTPKINNSNKYSISVYIDLSKDFSKIDYENFYYDLYETARHEFEHCRNYRLNKRPGKRYEKVYNMLMNEPFLYSDKDKLIKHMQLVSQFVLSDEEIMSYVRSIVYVAKKKKKEIDDVIKQIFNRIFFNNNRDNIMLAQGDKNAIKIMDNVKNKWMMEIDKLYPNIMETFW